MDDLKLARGHLLLQQGRPEEAEAFFKEAVAGNPDNARAWADLAWCLQQQEGKKKEALETIDRAIGLEPEIDHFQARKSTILSKLHRDREALEAADAAITLGPADSFNHAVKAQALCGLSRWDEAEEYCRKAVELDSSDGFAKNLLAMILGIQGKTAESTFASEQLLSDDPEDPWAHFNAGRAALRRHDHRTAEKHFREALRLDGDFEAARAGLLESFKARSPFYRTYLRYCFWMQRFSRGARWAIIIGLYLGFRFGRTLLEAVHPIAAGALTVIYLLFVLWIWLAPGVGNLLILLDRSARHALKRSEAIDGLAVGGGLILGLLLIGLAFAFDSMPLMLLGGALVFAVIPASLTFDNESRRGRRIFGAITAFVLATGVFASVFVAIQPDEAELPLSLEILIVTAVLSAVLCTWIANIPSLRRETPE